MGFSFGGFIALHRAELRLPLTEWQRLHGPEEDLGVQDSLDAFVALIDGRRLQMTLEETSMDDATARDARTPAVTSYGRSVLMFDRSRVLGCEAETPGALTALDRQLAELSALPQFEALFAYSLDGISDSYFFAVFAGSARVRRWSSLPTGTGLVGVDEGLPLSTEPAFDVHGEERIDRASRHLLGERSLLDLVGEHTERVFVIDRVYGR